MTDFGHCARRSCVIALAMALLGCVATTSVEPDVDTPTDNDANAAIAASVPSTDIVLIELAPFLQGVEPATARIVMQRRGYDNQPSFSPDSRSVWFSSIVDDQQSDIYRYDVDSGTVTRITTTPQSEYSPTPLTDGGFSCVQVALDGTQRLWRYLDGQPVAAIRDDITGVGYHAWLKADTLALFIVDDPVRLEIASLDGAPPRVIASNTGRSLHRTTRGTLAYVQKDPDGPDLVIEYDPSTHTQRSRAPLPFAGEDLVWLADGSALSANARTIYRLGSGSAQWEEVGSLARSVHGDITRMAVSPDGQWLALVVTESD